MFYNNHSKVQNLQLKGLFFAGNNGVHFSGPNIFKCQEKQWYINQVMIQLAPPGVWTWMPVSTA